MLTSEAVLLLLRAATLGQGGEVFVLDMGEPVRIWDLANRMVELAGLRPNIDIPIIVTGLRPGEKLFEELLTAEEGTTATSANRVFRARTSDAVDYCGLLARVERLTKDLLTPNAAVVKQTLTRLVASYRPDPCLGLSPSCHQANGNPATRGVAADRPTGREPAIPAGRPRPALHPIPRGATA